jgi:tetratricopeptide (TPR) repeat protein
MSAQTTDSTAIQEHYQRAEQARKAGQNEIAIKEFREILRLNPGNAEAHANLGVIAYTSNNYAEAENEFRAALHLRPSLWSAKAFLGMCEVRLGHSRQAKPLLAESFGHIEDTQLKSQTGMDLISIYGRDKEFAQALEILQVLERGHPNDPNLLYTAYRTYTELAAGTLAMLAQIAPESAQMHRILAQAQQNQDDFPGAIAQYRKALEIDPKLPGLHFELGQVILANSTGESARQEAEKEFLLALAENPADANSQYMLGEIAWLRAKPDQALEHYAAAVRLEPDFSDARIAMGKALMSLGRAEEALQQLSEAVRVGPQNEVAHYRMAQAYGKLGRKEDAERELAVFRRLRDSHLSAQALYRQVEEHAVPRQTVAPDELQ